MQTPHTPKYTEDVPSFLSHPWQLMGVSVVFAVIVTIGVLGIVFRDFSFTAIMIAVFSAAPASYLFGSMFRRYSRIIQSQNDELRTLNAELQSFTRTVAHDLKAPLNGVVMYSGLLLQTDLPDEKRDETLQKLEKSGRDMASIIDSLLMLASARAEQVPLGSVELDKVYQHATERLQSLIREREPKITTPDEWPTVHAYGPWVEAIFTNLLSNAIKYGGTPPELTFNVKAEGDFARVELTDNGPGLSEADQANLFTEFAQTTVGRIEGHGLGLSIVKRITERLGGDVGVKSTLGKGSTFWFTLPQAQSPENPA